MGSGERFVRGTVSDDSEGAAPTCGTMVEAQFLSRFKSQQHHPETSEEARWEGNEAARFGVCATRVPLHPDEAMAAARSRVAKLKTVLATLAEDDETYTTIIAALQKAEAQAQERPISEQIKNTQQFLGRKQKRVEEARQDAMKAREALSKALAVQEEQEALLAEGEKRLAALQEKEKAMPSPFTVEELVMAAHVQAEFSRLQGIIDGLQRELPKIRGVQIQLLRTSRTSVQLLRPIASDDDEDECRRKKPRTWGANNTTCDHRQTCAKPHDWFALLSSTLRCSRYGFRGVRVGEASNPGPPSEFDLTVVDSSDDEPTARRMDHEAGAGVGTTNESEGVRTRRRLVIVGGQTQVDEPCGVTVRDEVSQ